MTDTEKMKLLIEFMQQVIARHEATHQHKTSDRQVTVDTIINDYRNVEDARALLKRLGIEL